MASIGNFMVDNRLFPRSPGHSLLFTDKEVKKLQEKGYHVSRYQVPGHMGETNPSCGGKESAKATGTLDKKCSKHSSPTKACPESEDKASKHQKDKEDSKSPHKCTGSPTHRSSARRGEKEPCLEKPIQTFKVSSLSYQLHDTDNLFSFSGPVDTSTPSKVRRVGAASGPYPVTGNTHLLPVSQGRQYLCLPQWLCVPSH